MLNKITFNRAAIVLTVFSVAILAASATAPSAHADAWTDLLKQGGLTKEQLRFDPLDLQQVGGAELQGPFFKAVHGEPLRIPFYVRMYRQLMLDYSKEPFNAVTSALLRAGTGVRRTLEGDPLGAIERMSKTKGALVASIAHLHKLGGKPLTPAQQAELRKRVGKLSPETSTQLAFLLEAEAHALEWRQRALSTLDKAFLQKAFAERILPPKREDQEDHNGLNAIQRKLLKEVDLPVLMAGGLDLVLAVQRGNKFSQLTPAESFEWSTPLGWISVHGDAADNTYKADKPYLLIVDAGGNDTYLTGGGTSDFAHPVSIIIDLKGNDRYLAQADLDSVLTKEDRPAAQIKPAFGAGVFGYGILLDAKGNDTYRGFRQTQGRGDYGIGLLWDQQGDDSYECWTQGQGSADFGAGLLIDASGADHYTATFAAQGFAGPAAAGVLIDNGSEDDQYKGNDEQIDFPSLIDKKHNVSFVQGAALGVRADGTDGHGLAGGFAALVDGGGANQFKAGFFAQGIAYWYGVGWLSTGDGNDSFAAGKYAQGAATHFGVGILHDTGGNDAHTVQQELGTGHGHDYGVGFFLDDGGDDSYNAPNFSLGCASAQGIGIFWDRAGNDKYESKEKEILGCASLRVDLPTFRITSRTIGLFLDTGGRNEFKVDKKELRSGRWVSPNLSLPPGTDNRTQQSLIGLGRIVDEPKALDPF